MEDIFSPESFRVAILVLVKLGIAVVLGGAIGFEREMHGRPAGLRTHMLVALGVSLFCIISGAYAGSDPTRISAQVVTGIGFLGAGTILRMGAEVRGLTSAASIWATSAISMAVARGGPYLIVAAIATVLALITLGLVDNMEKKFRPVAHPSELFVVLQRRADLHDLIEKLNFEGFDVKAIRVLKSEPTIEVSLQVAGTGTAVLQTACSLHGVSDARWTDGSNP